MRQILVSAYGCEPDKGSEQGVGWHWVIELAKIEKILVITRSNNRLNIEASFPCDLSSRVEFVYYDLPKIFSKIKKKERGLYLYYFFWQLGAYKIARRLEKAGVFDYCLHLTFGSMWLPTFMYLLKTPFIWGPIGGAESIPPSYISTLSLEGRLQQYLRRMMIRCVSFNPFFLLPAYRAKAIIARTIESKTVFPKNLHEKIKVFLETGMSREVLTNKTIGRDAGREDDINLIYVGRLVYVKNVETAILAFAAALRKSNKRLRFSIIGDGPLRDNLVKIVKSQGIASYVKFKGRLKQVDVISEMQRSQIFLFPSLKEGGTWSLMEAMAVGLPVVCLNTSGMHVITDDKCAIRITPSSQSTTINQMTEAIVKLANSEKLRDEMGKAGKQRIESKFLWESKGEFMKELLQEIDLKMEKSDNTK